MKTTKCSKFTVLAATATAFILFFVLFSGAKDAAAASAPVLTSLSPASVPVGTGGKSLTLIGTNFLSTSTVTYNGGAHSVSFINSTKLMIWLTQQNNSVVGNYPVVVTNPSGGASNPVNLAITGAVAPSPVVSLSPGTLTFANQAVGATSAAQSIKLSNTGNAALTLTSLAITGTNASAFAQTNTCGSSVAAGASCTISVTFKPAASGTLTAAVSLTDNATGSPTTVGLTGTAGSVSTVASLTPSSLAFGSEPAGTTSASQVATLSNTGGATLNITSITFTGANASNFKEADTCGSSLAAGGSCTIVILFTPSATGADTASLTIADNASPSSQSVSLAGTGTHDVILSWTDSSTSGIMGYNVYRGTTSGAENSTPLNSIPINGTAFTDENVTAGASYYYVFTAVESDGTTQSAASKEASATVPTT